MTAAVFRTPNSHEKMVEAAKVIGNLGHELYMALLVEQLLCTLPIPPEV